MRAKWLVVLVSALSIAALTGCGSGGGGDAGTGGTVVSDGDTVVLDTVGLSNCVTCHNQQGVVTSTWLRSAHGNPNGSPGSSGPYAEADHPDCYQCHNQRLEGQNLPDIFTAGDLIGSGRSGDVYADTARNVVVCESCHGNGSAHRGVGPIPYPRPDWEQCVSCHDYVEGVSGDRSSHIENWGMLASSVGNSAHNNSDNLHAGSAKCQRCHTAEGSVEFAQYTGDKTVMTEMDAFLDDAETIPGDNVAALDETNVHAVTCATCHIPHDDTGRWETAIVNDNGIVSAEWDPNANGVADQFDFCTSCHTYYNQDGDQIGSGQTLSGASAIFPGTNDTPVAWNLDTAPHYHNTAWYRLIPSTHFDNPLTGPQDLDRSGNLNQNTLIEGYVLRQPVVVNSAILGDDSPCFDCHGHEFRTNTRRSRDTAAADEETPQDYGSTIHTQWASSAHAAHLLEAKYAAADAVGTRNTTQVDAVMQAAASDATADGGFTHYNWDRSGRADCQMCHTATGAANFMMSPATYNSANNDFSHLDGWAADPAAGSPQNELLYCWGCHENAGTGTLRAPGAITLAYPNLDGVNPTLPDLGGSNVCVNCHSGRGGMVKFLDGDTFDPSGAAISGGTDTHYYAAGATINQALTNIGYMYYNSATYADKSYFAHNSLGCAECHMTSDESHTYQVVEKDATGTITAVVSETCVECHDGEHALFVADTQVGTSQLIWNGTAAVASTVTQAMADDAGAEMEHEAHGYHAALEALGDVLTDAGTTPQSNYPYFSGTATDQGHGGAMHNWSYLHHEPGGYAHNRYYVKRLIFDSIDWLTNDVTGSLEVSANRVMDGAIYLDPTLYSATIEWLGGNTTTGVIDSRP